MSDMPFDRSIINRKEKPLSSDFNRFQSQIDRAFRDYLDLYYAPRTSANNERRRRVSGFIGDAFRVQPKSPGAMAVEITPGFGFQAGTVSPGTDTAINSIVGLSDLSAFKPLVLSTAETIAIDAADAALERIDIIEVKATRTLTDLTTVEIFDETIRQFTNTPNIAKTLTWDLSGRVGKVAFNQNNIEPIGYKTGQFAAVGFANAPPATAGYIKIAEIYVGPTTTTIETSDPGLSGICDWRPLHFSGGVGRVSGTVQMTNPGAGKSVFTSINAPPGVIVTGFGNPGNVKLYVVAGESAFSSYAVSSVWCQIVTYDGAKVHNPNGVSITNTTFDSAKAASVIDGSRNNLTIKVAKSQPALEVNLSCSQTTGGVTAAYVVGPGPSVVFGFTIDFER